MGNQQETTLALLCFPYLTPSLRTWHPVGGTHHSLAKQAREEVRDCDPLTLSQRAIAGWRSEASGGARSQPRFQHI